MANRKDGGKQPSVGDQNGDDLKRLIEEQRRARKLRDAGMILEFPGGRCPDCQGTPESGHLPGFQCGSYDDGGE